MSPKEPNRLLVVDDEPGLRQMLHILFSRQGYDVVCVSGCQAACEAIVSSPQPFPVIITDLLMPDGSGIEVLRAAKKRQLATEVIVMTAHSTIDAAVDTMRQGAYDFIGKPFEPSELSALIVKALEKGCLVAENNRLRARVKQESPPIFGRSLAMQKIADLVGKVANSRTTVLITGESGTGKERVARALHDQSDRCEKPFLVINCGALPEHLMESELFGYEKGAFTGATSRRGGIFRDAHGGTVFLDEVGELPASLQVKLLRVLQERKVRPVGGSYEEPVDVRVLAATNRVLEDDVRVGKFRQDLYYRLNVIRITLPPLRERSEDIAALALSFLERFADETGKSVRGVDPEALRALTRYSFPGNVRELENVMERAVTFAASPMIGLGELPMEVSGHASSPTSHLLVLPDTGCNLDQVLGEIERRYLIQALERAGGVRKRAAHLLQVTFRSLRYRLAKHGLDPDGDLTGFTDDEGATDILVATTASQK